MDIRTGDDIVSDGQAACAGKAEIGNVLFLLQGGGCGNQLEGGAGRIGAGEKAVEIDPVIGRVFVYVGGRILGVVGGGADQTFDIAVGVIIDGHHALVSIERLVSGFVEGGV